MLCYKYLTVYEKKSQRDKGLKNIIVKRPRCTRHSYTKDDECTCLPKEKDGANGYCTLYDLFGFFDA